MGVWSSGLALAVCMLAFAACANPVPPSGGPEDRTPPRIVASTPTAGALRVQDGTLRVTFSEALDEGSVARSVNVRPESATPPRVEAEGRTVTIRLGDLRPATTYVVTFDTGLRDLRGVPLAAPLTLAFSTGDRIDDGVLTGRVVDGLTGAGRGTVDVLAWAASDSVRGDSAWGTLPLVRTQTGADGTFRLTALAPVPLFVVAVEDRNRNRRVDAGEAFAPPPVPALVPRPETPDSTAARDSTAALADRAALPVWRLARPDTTAPRAERVRAVAATRLAVRYAEPVRLVTASLDAWRLADTTGAAVPLAAVWQATPAPTADADAIAPDGAALGREVMVETAAPLAARGYRLTTGAVADSAGTVGRGAVLRVTGVATRDTLTLRLLGLAPPDGRLVPGETAALVLSQPLGADSLRLAVADTLGRPIARRLVPDASGTRVSIVAAAPFVVRLADARPDTAFRVVAYDVRDLGGLTGRVERVEAGAGGAIVVVAEGAGRRVVTRAAPDGTFAFTGLPAGPYRLMAWHDRDGDGRWTPGRLRPWQPAEVLVRVAEPATVRARWDTEVPEPIRL